MPLPAAAQEQRERLQAEQSGQPTAEQLAETARLEAERVAAEKPSTPETTRVTISKEEFNTLQAAKDKVNAAERRAEAVRADLEAMQSRLTELEQAAKGSGKVDPPLPPAQAASLAVDATQIPLTAKEQEDFEADTIALMEKIATNVSRREIAAYNKTVEAKLGDVEITARNAVTSVGKVSSNSFTDKVRNKVAEFSDFDTIVRHVHWQDFLNSDNDDAGSTYGELIQKHVAEQTEKDVGRITNIFRKFYDRYMKDAPNADGYAGAVPSGTGAVDLNAGSNKPKMLKYSDRKKLSEDYIARRIKYEDYEAAKKEFDIADREGRIDYDA